MVRGKSIIVGLALLLMSSSAFASQAIGRAKNSYQQVKRTFSANPSNAQNQTDIQNALDAVTSSINAASGLPQVQVNIHRNWVNTEQNWINSMLGNLPRRAPVVQPVVQVAPPPALPAPMPVAAPAIAPKASASLAAQRLDKLIEEFNNAQSDDDIQEMRLKYAAINALFNSRDGASLDRGILKQIDQVMRNAEEREEILRLEAAFEKAQKEVNLAEMNAIRGQLIAILQKTNALSAADKNGALKWMQEEIDKTTQQLADTRALKQILDLKNSISDEFEQLLKDPETTSVQLEAFWFNLTHRIESKISTLNLSPANIKIKNDLLENMLKVIRKRIDEIKQQENQQEKQIKSKRAS